MCSEENMILEFNQDLKCAKVSSNHYADLESLIKKVERSKNNPKKLFATK